MHEILLAGVEYRANLTCHCDKIVMCFLLLWVNLLELNSILLSLQFFSNDLQLLIFFTAAAAAAAAAVPF